MPAELPHAAARLVAGMVALLGVLVAFATLESALGLCAGCVVFRQLMRWG